MNKLSVEVEEDENMALREYEEAVYTAEQEVRESFYHIGMALKRIKDDEPFKPSNGHKANGKTTFKSWAAYCTSERCGYTKKNTDRVIRAASQRELLPELKSGTASVPLLWTIETASQLARLELKKDVNLAVRKIRAAIKDGEKFGTRLVKRIVDDILGVTHTKKQKQAKALATTPTLAESLAEMAETVSDWHDSLAKVSGKGWNEMDEESPGAVKHLTQVLSGFISFLKE